MDGLNQVALSGNLTRDPEVFQFESSQKVTCSIAVNKSWKTDRVDSDGKVIYDKRTTYLDCEAWGPRGNIMASWLKKGSGVIFSGELQMAEWEDKDTGKKRSRHFLNVLRIIPQDRRGDKVQSEGDTSFDPDSFEEEESF
jgi:single-strand DNA-binding protein